MAILHLIIWALGLNTMIVSAASMRSISEFPNTTDSRQLSGYDRRIWTLCGIDLNIPGVDTFNEPHPNPDTCVDRCNAEASGCDAATWTDYNGGTCWFKITLGGWVMAVPKVGAISFLRVDDPSRLLGPAFPSDVDMPGNDIGNQRASRKDCSGICARNDYCFAYTWTDYNGGTCWLKKKASPYVSKPGAVSAFAPRQTNPNTCLA